MSSRGWEPGRLRSLPSSPPSSVPIPAVLDDYPLPERLELPSFTPPARLRPTLYPSEEGVPGRPAGGRRDQPAKMLVAAIRIHLDLDKNIKVSGLTTYSPAPELVASQ